MTIRDYISNKLRAFGLTEAEFVDFSLDTKLNLDDTLTSDNLKEVQKGMCHILIGLILSPVQKSVNENGFSVSWDMDKVTSLYLHLSRQCGEEIDSEIAALLGISTIRDISDIW